MLSLLLSLLVLQGGKVGNAEANPLAPPPRETIIDATALGQSIGESIAQKLTERLDAQQAILTRLVAQAESRPALPPPATSCMANCPGPATCDCPCAAALRARPTATEAAPARKMYVGKDATGRAWQAETWKELNDWIERRNATAQAPVVTAPVSYTMPATSYTLPSVSYTTAPPVSYSLPTTYAAPLTMPVTSGLLGGTLGSCVGGACR